MADKKDTEKKPAASKKGVAKEQATPKKTAAKKEAPKKSAPKKTDAGKSTPKKAAVKKDSKSKETKKTASKKAGQTIRITQTGSPIGRQAYQRKTLIGLGLNKLHKTRELEDTPSVRGMIRKVSHLVKIEDAA